MYINWSRKVSFSKKIVEKFKKWVFWPKKQDNGKVVHAQNTVSQPLSTEQFQNITNIIRNADLSRGQIDQILEHLSTSEQSPDEIYKYVMEQIRMYRTRNAEQEQLLEERETSIQQVDETTSQEILNYIQNNALINPDGRLIGVKEGVVVPPPSVFDNFYYFTQVVTDLAIDEAAADRFIGAISQIKEQLGTSETYQEETGVTSILPNTLKQKLTSEEGQLLLEKLGQEGSSFSVEDPFGKNKNLYPVYYISKQSKLFYNNYIGEGNQNRLGEFLTSSTVASRVNNMVKYLKQNSGVQVTREEAEGAFVSRLVNSLSQYRRYNSDTRDLVTFADPRFEFFFRYPQYLPDDLRALVGQTDNSNAGQVERNNILQPRKQELYDILDNLIVQKNKDVMKFTINKAANLGQRDLVKDQLGAESLEIESREEGGRGTERPDISGLASEYTQTSEQDKYEKSVALRNYFKDVFNEVRSIGNKVSNYYKTTNQPILADIIDNIIQSSVKQLEDIIQPENDKITDDLARAGVVADYHSKTGRLNITSDKGANFASLVRPRLLVTQIDKIGREKLINKKKIDRMSAAGENSWAISQQLNIPEEEVRNLVNQDMEEIESIYTVPDDSLISRALKEEGQLALKTLDFAEKNPGLKPKEILKALGIMRFYYKHRIEGKEVARTRHPSVIFESPQVKVLLDGLEKPGVADQKRQEIQAKYINQSDPDFFEQYKKMLTTRHKKAVSQYIGDGFTQWGRSLAEVIPETSDLARKIFLDLTGVHSYIKKGERWGRTLTEDYYNILGKSMPTEVKERVDEYKATRKNRRGALTKYDRVFLAYNSYLDAEKMINNIKSIHKQLIKTSSSVYTEQLIKNAISDVIETTKKKFALYQLS